LVGLPGRGISPKQGLYLHRTPQKGKTRTNIHALSGILTLNPSMQTVKTYASDRVAAVSGYIIIYAGINRTSSKITATLSQPAVNDDGSELLLSA
jgi:hypothetical protein